MAYAEGTAGSVTHLSMALFAKRAGLDMTNVSYRGNAPAMNDVIAGHLKMMFSNVSDALPHAASGAIRLLAVSTAQRAPQAPDVPTVAESGFPGFNVVTWNGLAAPAGTPREIVDKIAGEIGRAVKDPQFAGAAQGRRRRSARQHAGRIRRHDQGRHRHLGGRGRGDRPQGAIGTTESKMSSHRPIVIAGGGPVGVVTALAFARQGFEVRLFEAETRVNDMPRAATTHAATLEMLEGLGLVEEVTQRGLIEPKFRIWDRASREMIVEFDFGTAEERHALSPCRAVRAAQARQHDDRAAQGLSQRQRDVLGARCRVRAA